MKFSKSKILLILLFITFIALFFCACDTSNPAKTAEAFLDAISKQDFKLAYSYTWPYDSTTLSEEDFVKKYQAIFDGLGIQEMEITNSFVTTDSFGTLYTYTASYITEDYGTFTYDFDMELRSVESVTYVVWGQDLIFPFMEYEDKLHVETLPAIRGEIFTEDGDILAKNDFATAVYMDVTQIKNILSLSESLSGLLNVTEEDIIDTFNHTLALNQELGRNNVGVIATYPNDYFTDEDKKNFARFRRHRHRYRALCSHPLLPLWGIYVAHPWLYGFHHPGVFGTPIPTEGTHWTHGWGKPDLRVLMRWSYAGRTALSYTRRTNGEIKKKFSIKNRPCRVRI